MLQNKEGQRVPRVRFRIRAAGEWKTLTTDDLFEVSDADTLLAYLNPKAKKPDQGAILTREGCGLCGKARALLKDLGYDYVEVPLGRNGRSKVVGAITGKASVPQVFVNGALIGGWEELERWAKKAA